MREVGETDLTHSQRSPALAQVVKLLADADSIGGGAAGQVAVGLDPGDRAVKALLVVLIGFDEGRGHFGELEVEHVDGEGELSQPLAEISSAHTTPTPHCHDLIVRTFVWRVKKSCC